MSEELARLNAKVRALRYALEDVRVLIDCYADADHNGSSFIPNDAMRAVQIIDEALGHE